MAATTVSVAPAGALRRRVLNIALPAVGEQLLNTAVGLADVYLVGHLSAAASAQLGYSSAAALAGAGLANQMVWIVTVMFMAVSVGSTALIARAIGAGDAEQARRVVQQSFILGAIAGLIASVGAYFLARPFLVLLGATPEMLPLGEAFLHISTLSFCPAALLFVGTACLRGAGDTRTPLYVMLGVNVLNMGISWLLINGNAGMPVLGVVGAATGAAVSRSLGGLAMIILLLRGRSGLRFVPRAQIDWSLVRRVLHIGGPAAGEQLVFQGALLIFARFVTGLGTVAYAAHNVTITIESVSFLPGMGYAAAATTLIGQSLGARRPDEAEHSGYETLLQGGLLMMILGGLMVALPGWFLRLFIDDPAVIAAGIIPLQAAGLIQPAFAVNMILSGALRGAGDTRWPLYSKVISTWGVRLPLTFLVVGLLGFGLNGIWFAMCVDFTVQALLAAWRYKAGVWKQLDV